MLKELIKAGIMKICITMYFEDINMPFYKFIILKKSNLFYQKNINFITKFNYYYSIYFSYML